MGFAFRTAVRLVVVLLALVPAASPIFAASVMLQLKGEHTFRHEPLLLSDLVSCQGDRQICSEIPELDMGIRVTPGKTQYISADQIIDFLKVEWPGVEVGRSGPASVKVVSPARSLLVEEVEAALASRLEALLAGNTTVRLAVEKVQMTSPLIVMEESHEISFPLLEDKDATPESVVRALTSTFTIQAKYQSKRGVQNFYVQPQLRIEEFAPVAKVAIQSGAVISKHNVEKQWRLRSLGRGGESIAGDLTDIYGLTARRFIGAGSVVAMDALAQPILVHRGERVNVASAKDGIAVQLKAVALGNGTAGQTIDVETVGAKRRLQARVLDSSSVEVIKW